jgi:hypothetical protein
MTRSTKPELPLQIAAALGLAALGTVAMIAVIRLWPAHDPVEVAHDHPDLPPDHPHMRDHAAGNRHALVIDGLHRQWPPRRA